MEGQAEKLSKDYSNYLIVNVNQEIQSVEDTIDDTLTRIDELSGHVGLISTQTNSDIAAAILAMKGDVLQLFQRVRKLEFAVAQVRQTVDAFDHLVSTAETELNVTAEAKIKNFLRPLFKKRVTSPTETTPPIFSSPPIFSTKEMFSTEPSSPS